MNRVKMPAGKFYIGDPCYVVEDNDDWSYLLGNSDYFQSRYEGSLPDGTRVVAFGTAWGDGMYGPELEYSVDAGLIGAVPWSEKLWAKYGEKLNDLGKVMDFPEPWEAWNDNGILHFGHIRIDTVQDNDEET